MLGVLNLDNNKDDQIITTKNSYNVFAIVGFVLGIISFFLNFFGIVGILAVVFSAIGLSQISKNQQKGKDKRNDSFIRVLTHFQKDFCKTP